MNCGNIANTGRCFLYQFDPLDRQKIVWRLPQWYKRKTTRDIRIRKIMFCVVSKMLSTRPADDAAGGQSSWELLEARRREMKQRREQIDFAARRRAAAVQAARDQKLKSLQARLADLERLQDFSRKRNAQLLSDVMDLQSSAMNHQPRASASQALLAAELQKFASFVEAGKEKWANHRAGHLQKGVPPAGGAQGPHIQKVAAAAEVVRSPAKEREVAEEKRRAAQEAQRREEEKEREQERDMLARLDAEKQKRAKELAAAEQRQQEVADTLSPEKAAAREKERERELAAERAKEEEQERDMAKLVEERAKRAGGASAAGEGGQAVPQVSAGEQGAAPVSPSRAATIAAATAAATTATEREEQPQGAGLVSPSRAQGHAASGATQEEGEPAAALSAAADKEGEAVMRSRSWWSTPTF